MAEKIDQLKKEVDDLVSRGNLLLFSMYDSEEKLGEPEKLERIRKLLKELRVPVELPLDLTEEKLIDLIKRDKRAVNRWPKFVLTRQIGQVHCPDDQWAVDVERPIVEKVLRKLLK